MESVIPSSAQLFRVMLSPLHYLHKLSSCLRCPPSLLPTQVFGDVEMDPIDWRSGASFRRHSSRGSTRRDRLLKKQQMERTNKSAAHKVRREPRDIVLRADKWFYVDATPGGLRTLHASMARGLTCASLKC